MLNKSLITEFSGEDGVDAGALRNDFFEEALRQADGKFFKGQKRKIPTYHWGSDEDLEIVRLGLLALSFREDLGFHVSIQD